MGRILIDIAVGILTGALSGGVVLYFGLDAKVARWMSLAATSNNLLAITLIIAGLGGLLGILVWKGFGISDRLEGVFGPSAEFALEFTGSQSDGPGVNAIRLGARIHNTTNDRFVTYLGSTEYIVGGKSVQKTSMPNPIELGPKRETRILGPTANLSAAPNPVRVIVSIDYGFAGRKMTYSMEAVYELHLHAPNLVQSGSNTISIVRKKLK